MGMLTLLRTFTTDVQNHGGMDVQNHGGMDVQNHGGMDKGIYCFSRDTQIIIWLSPGVGTY